MNTTNKTALSDAEIGEIWALSKLPTYTRDISIEFARAVLEAAKADTREPVATARVMSDQYYGDRVVIEQHADIPDGAALYLSGDASTSQPRQFPEDDGPLDGRDDESYETWHGPRAVPPVPEAAPSEPSHADLTEAAVMRNVRRVYGSDPYMLGMLKESFAKDPAWIAVLATPAQAAPSDMWRNHLENIVDVWADSRRPSEDRHYTGDALRTAIESANTDLAATPVAAHQAEPVTTVHVGRDHICRDAEIHDKALCRAHRVLKELLRKSSAAPHKESLDGLPLYQALDESFKAVSAAIMALRNTYMVEVAASPVQSAAPEEGAKHD